VDDDPGRDMVFLSPDERVLEIFHSGYEPLKLILSEYGIQLHPKEVWKIKIKGQAKTSALLPVIVFVQPPDARITIDGKTVHSGKPVELSKGRHQLLIKKDGFKTVSKSIIVSKDQVVFNETLSEVDLQQVLIKSTPEGARIYLDNVEKGLTDDGFFLYPGQYRLKLIKPGYLEANETITVTEGGRNTFSYTLSKNSGSLSLNVTPPDAKVLINKEDYSNRSNIELAPGRYKIEISKSGYHPQSETITIERGRTLSKTYNLTAKTGKLQFKVKPLSAKVTLKQNGRTVQSWTGMKYIKDLPVGDYELECSDSGYGAQTKKITINERRTTVTEIKLRKGVSSYAQTGRDLLPYAPKGSSISPYSQTEKGGITYGTMTDIDGNVYKTVKIGNQVWMAENLRVTHYRNGDPIPNVISKSEWKNLRTGAYCNYDNNLNNAATYGRLYNWYAVNDPRNIAPPGWHVPTDEDWKELEKYLAANVGGKLKERGRTHWESPNKGATNSSGFTALPGGIRGSDGAFGTIGYYGFWWSATEYGSRAYLRYLAYDDSYVRRSVELKHLGYSVRLVRDY